MNFIAGASLGLVIGFFAGLSASPVVGSLLASISSIAIAFVTLRKAPDRQALLRVTGFGIGCVLAGASAVYVRANNLLGLTPKRAVEQWQAAGIEPADQKVILKNYLTTALSSGRSFSAITLGIDNLPIESIPPEKTKDDQPPASSEKEKKAASETHGKRDPAPPYIPSVLGVGGFFSILDTPTRYKLVDVLDRKPDWETARKAYSNILNRKPEDLDWLNNTPLTDQQKVSVLREMAIQPPAPVSNETSR